MRDFKKYDIWIDAMIIVDKIYNAIDNFPKDERFSLSSQMARSAVSIPSNIAEGSAKSSNKDFARFLEMSIGSSYELETELTIASKLNYIGLDVFALLQNKIVEIQKMIIGFKNKLD